jgi:predicted metal-binding protein
MTKHTLFVCKSCRRSSQELSENQPCDGSIFLDKITTLSTEKFAVEQLEIQPVGCLWVCDRGCAVAVSNPDKPTYLLVDLPPDEENASALLEFTQMYISNRKGAVNWDKLPKQLESAFLGCIPSVINQEISEY